MCYIKGPEGVDLQIGPSVLTEEDKRILSEAIAAYKAKAAQPVHTEATELPQAAS